MNGYLKYILQSDEEFTKNKKYEIIAEDQESYTVIDNLGNEQIFTKHAWEDGKTFEDWFEYVE